MSAFASLGWRRAVLAVLLAVGVTFALYAPAASAAATVSVAATTTVNIRTGPGLHYRVVGQLVRGQRIRAYQPVRGTWVRVHFAGGEAYMAREYLTTSATLAGPTRITTTGLKITTARLNLRSAPDPKRGVIGTLAEGTRLRLTGKIAHGFAETRHTGKSRWVSMTYLAKTMAAAPSSRPTPAPAPSGTAKGQKAYAFARTQLGKPYRYGAAGPDAYDCSGLMLTSWAKAGVSLPRTTATQFHIGRRVAKGDLRVGDLVFYYGPTPSHVGMYAGNGQIIHAPRPGKAVQHVPIGYMPYAGAVRPG
jgi:cell wall-associated NlpC family hydrolase